jgi:hypothetical protein
LKRGAHLNSNKEHENERAQLNGDKEHGKEGAQSDTEVAHYNLRRRKIFYVHKYANMQCTQVGKVNPKKPSQQLSVNLHIHMLTTGFLFSQLTAKAGIKAFEDKAINAIIQEYKQLDKKNAFKPQSKESLSIEGQKQALHSITLVKEKRRVRIKGRIVADGRPLRGLYPTQRINVAHSIHRGTNDNNSN